mmetsp:Transcript_40408/g.101488  ORF Transcript_40408/g.101488 Transcript_40408/m.101488 type:complete len:232 (-) Transcript_40408:913-1608(-)
MLVSSTLSICCCILSGLYFERTACLATSFLTISTARRASSCAPRLNSWSRRLSELSSSTRMPFSAACTDANCFFASTSRPASLWAVLRLEVRDTESSAACSCFCNLSVAIRSTLCRSLFCFSSSLANLSFSVSLTISEARCFRASRACLASCWACKKALLCCSNVSKRAVSIAWTSRSRSSCSSRSASFLTPASCSARLRFSASRHFCANMTFCRCSSAACCSRSSFCCLI